MHSYQRMRWGVGGGGITDAVKTLLIANGVVYLLQMVVGPEMILGLGLIPRWAWSRF